MEFLELAKKRYAVRNYLDKEIEKEVMDKILEAAHIAPTAANRQPQRLYVLDKDDMKQLEGAVNLHGANKAIVVCADEDEAWVRKAYDDMNAGVIDASIVTTMMMMEAKDLGLGTLWVCAFDPEKIKAYCQLKEHVIPVNILCLGYCEESDGDMDRFTQTRKPMEEIILKGR